MLALTWWLAPLAARGAPAVDGEVEKDSPASELIQQGISLRRAGKDEEALTVFLEADRRVPNSARILLHITTAAQGSGKWLLAHQYLQKASAHRNEPYYQRYVAAIRVIEETIAQHVGRLRVIGSPSGATVSLNGAVVARLPMADDVVLELGTYEMEVAKPGYFTLRRPLTVSTGIATEAVELNVLRRVSDTLPAAGATSAISLQSPLGPDAARPDHPRLWLTTTLAVGGALLLGTSATFFVIREGDASKWNDNTRCLDPNRPLLTREQLCGDLRDSAITAERVAVTTGLLGIGFGGAALLHWLLSSPSDVDGTKSASFVPVCTAGPSGIVCRTNF